MFTIVLPVILFIKTIFSLDLKQKKNNPQLSFKVHPFGIKSILKYKNCITKNLVINARQFYCKNIAKKEIYEHILTSATTGFVTVTLRVVFVAFSFFYF